jgi:hypothetical protein
MVLKWGFPEKSCNGHNVPTRFHENQSTVQRVNGGVHPTYTHTYIHTYIHTHTHIHTYIHTYIHSYIHTCTYIHTYIHTHIHTYIHIYVHTYTHTYIHTYIRRLHGDSISVLSSLRVENLLMRASEELSAF